MPSSRPLWARAGALLVVTSVLLAFSGGARADTLPQPSASQASHVQPFRLGDYEFLERQAVFFSPNPVVVNGTRSNLAFEALVGPHVPLFGKQFGGDDPLTRRNTELRLIFSFLSDLRLVTSFSTPVLTPSYMPRLRLQVLQRHVGAAPGTRMPISDWRYGFTVDLWSHHSNGQDGCRYLPLPASPSADCTPHAQASGINERNGDFSTNYLGLTFHLRYSRDFTDPASLAKKYDARTFSVLGSAGIQFHHDFPGAGLEADLRPLWGRVHGFGEMEGRWNPRNEVESWWGYAYLRGRLDLASGGEDPQFPGLRARNTRYTGEVGWICTRLLGVGLFARIVSGREYYNIEFTQDVTRFQFGLTIDTAGHAGALNVKSTTSGGPPPPDTDAPPGAPPPPFRGAVSPPSP